MKINEEFLKGWLEHKVVFNPQTQQEYDELMLWLEKNTDCRGFMGEPTKLEWFPNYDNLTGIYLGSRDFIMYGGIDYFKREGKKIVTFKELFSPFPKNLLEIGYMVEEEVCTPFDEQTLVKVVVDRKELDIIQTTFDNDLKHLYSPGEIKTIYRPVYNGVTTITEPQWEKVWERPVELFTLELKGNVKNKYYLAGKSGSKYDYKFWENVNNQKNYTGVFTETDINNLPNQDLIEALRKEPYKPKGVNK